MSPQLLEILTSPLCVLAIVMAPLAYVVLLGRNERELRRLRALVKDLRNSRRK